MKMLLRTTATLKTHIQPVSHTAWLGFTCVLSCFQQGCTSITTVAEMVNQGFITHEAIQYQTFDIKATIVVKEVRSTTAPNGFLVCDVIFKNIKNSGQTVWYKVEWKDDEGMLISSSLYHWQILRLTAQGEHTARFAALNASARSIHVQISSTNPN